MYGYIFINIIYVQYGMRLVASWPCGHADLAMVLPSPHFW